MSKEDLESKGTSYENNGFDENEKYYITLEDVNSVKTEECIEKYEDDDSNLTVKSFSCTSTTSIDSDFYESTFDEDELEEETPFIVERIIPREKPSSWFKGPSILPPIFKVATALILLSILLLCTVASKFSIIYIAKYGIPKNNNTSNDTKSNCTLESDSKKSSYDREVSLIYLCISMMIPPGFTFIKQLLVTFRKASYPWPTKKAIFWGVVGTAMESIAIVMFFNVTIAYVEDTGLNIILMNAISIFPSISDLYSEIKEMSYEKEMNLSDVLMKKRRANQIVVSILVSVAALLGIVGVSIALYLIPKDDKCYIVPTAIASILFLGVAWSPKVRELQIDQDLELICKEHTAIDINFNQSNSSSQSNLKKYMSKTGLTKKKKSVFQAATSRGKSSLINSFLKLIFLPTTFLICCKISNTGDITKFSNAIHLMSSNSNNKLLYMFLIQVISSFIGYKVAVITCTVTLQKLCFALPLTISTPLCIALIFSDPCDTFGIGHLESNVYTENPTLYIISTIALYSGQFLAVSYYIWRKQYIVMADESMLFWVPEYNGCLLEQNILLNRKNKTTNNMMFNCRKLARNSTIYICTTMYHEADYEMEQLLFSIAGVDKARGHSGRNIEAHIWFDDGVRDKTLKSYAIQLISLLSTTVEVETEDVFKLLTPYGMQLKWMLPGGMPFYIHLKDNHKVKNKKRWSQVMYMSYVLDFRERDNIDRSFILSTDADVKFMPEDVSALMDFMVRDPSVGAVCGRTYPMGSGPMVWYQTFDYAVGFWCQKVAEHVMGSVLCSPGCFSIYRCRALEDVLPIYASSVECALDFLKKDMGEDRWMCTLLVEKGWRLDYCASSTNSTYCPESFDEFFKQRRRWGPSTLANQIVLVQSQLNIRKNNDNINFLFIVYQVVMLMTSLIGPSIMLLLIASGLQMTFPSTFNFNIVLIVNLAIALFYVYICLFHDQNLQIKLALLMTVVYSIIMTVVIVGLIILVVDDVKNSRQYYFPNNTVTPIDITKLKDGEKTAELVEEFSFQFTPASIFLFFLVGLFTITAILHGKEGLVLVNGIWYLLCMPSFNLFLVIYSLANITDRSWGTRENSADKKTSKAKQTNTGMFCEVFKIFLCYQQENNNNKRRDSIQSKSPNEENPRREDDETNSVHSMEQEHDEEELEDLYPTDTDSHGSHNLVIPIEEWCTGDYSRYIPNFKSGGYDDTTFIRKMKEQDLINIGIIKRGHLKQLLKNIEKLPPVEIEEDVPKNVKRWLKSIGLRDYWRHFKNNSYDEPEALADLKMMDKKTLASTFSITKPGHLSKMMEAISHLKYSTLEQKKLRLNKREMEKIPPIELRKYRPREYKFWDRLKSACLLKEQAAFSQSTELQSNLFDLRNKTLAVFGICNALWLTIMLVIISQGDKLTLFKTSFVSVIFLMMNAILMIVQFISLLVHRFWTCLHYIARASFRPGSKESKSWSFEDDELFEEPSSEEMEEMQKYIDYKLNHRSKYRSNKAMERIENTMPERRMRRGSMDKIL